MPSLEQDIILDYAVQQFDGRLWRQAEMNIPAELEAKFYNSHWSCRSLLTGEPFPAPSFPHGISLNLIRKLITSLSNDEYAIIHWIGWCEQELNHPFTVHELWTEQDREVLQLIAAFNYDKLVHGWELVFTKPPEGGFEIVWNHQHRRATAWYYCQQMDELLKLHSKKAILTIQYILRQWGVFRILESRTVTLRRLEQLQALKAVIDG